MNFTMIYEPEQETKFPPDFMSSDLHPWMERIVVCYNLWLLIFMCTFLNIKESSYERYLDVRMRRNVRNNIPLVISKPLMVFYYLNHKMDVPEVRAAVIAMEKLRIVRRNVFSKESLIHHCTKEEILDHISYIISAGIMILTKMNCSYLGQFLNPGQCLIPHSLFFILHCRLKLGPACDRIREDLEARIRRRENHRQDWLDDHCDCECDKYPGYPDDDDSKTVVYRWRPGRFRCPTNYANCTYTDDEYSTDDDDYSTDSSWLTSKMTHDDCFPADDHITSEKWVPDEINIYPGFSSRVEFWLGKLKGSYDEFFGIVNYEDRWAN